MAEVHDDASADTPRDPSQETLPDKQPLPARTSEGGRRQHRTATETPASKREPGRG